MRERRQATINDLRQAIDCMPRATRMAMLQGITENHIIVGAYVNEDGVCPMLAAHRAGGRTSFISFAKTWDSFAFRGARVRLARRATARELLVLRTHLEASLLDDEGPAPDLAAVMAEHRELIERRTPRRVQDQARPGDLARSRELPGRPGWAWMRVVRRYDDYERALERLKSELDSSRELEPVA